MRWVLRYHFQLSLDLFDFIPDFPRALNLPSDSRCVLLGSLTRTRNSEVRHEISNVGGSFVINFYINTCQKKVCWTSKILGEILVKNVTFFCLFWCTGHRRLVFVAWRRFHDKNFLQFFKNFFQGFVKFSKVFHWFHVAKWWSAQNSG